MQSSSSKTVDILNSIKYCKKMSRKAEKNSVKGEKKYWH